MKKINKTYCRVPVWGVLHCRSERTQTQQARYNEFGREAGSRTGPLRGLRQRSGRIVGEQDRQWCRGGVKVYPRASSEDEFLFSSSDTTAKVFRCLSNCDPLFSWYLSGYIFFCSLHPGRLSVACADCYLSVCPIQRFPQLAVSCSRQGDTIQGSFLH